MATYSNTQASPFRLNRKPTTLNQYTAQGRTPAPAPAPTPQFQAPQHQVSRSDLMPSPQLGGISGAGRFTQPSPISSGQYSSRLGTQQLPRSSQPTYTPGSPPIPQQATMGGGQVMGAAPDTRSEYMASQGRLSGGDLAFGFGRPAWSAMDAAKGGPKQEGAPAGSRRFGQ